MTETVNYQTGEIATVDPSSEVAVTSYLQQARDWLATAVETTGPEQIARAKAEIATAAEATKQLGLSKEIQGDAAEMVRRAEYAVRKAVTKAQSGGDLASHGGDRASTPAGELASPVSFFKSKREYEDANAMADLEPEGFEEVLSEARQEGNLSRSNVAAKARDYIKDAAERLANEMVGEFPALKFFADRGEMRRVVDLGTALRGYEPLERARRLSILDKTIAYEKRIAAKPNAGPAKATHVPSIVSAFGFASKLLDRAGASVALNEIASADRAEVSEWHSALKRTLSDLELLVNETAPKLRRIK